MVSTNQFVKVRPPIPRGKIYGVIAVIFSFLLAVIFVYSVFYLGRVADNFPDNSLQVINDFSYFSIAIPIGLVSLFIFGTGFWIGWTILTIKVVLPMPEIVEKKDYSKVKAFILCLVTLGLAVLLIYGLYLRNYWAIAIPATAISLVILGAVFWVGIAILTTRTTLPNHKKES